VQTAAQVSQKMAAFIVEKSGNKGEYHFSANSKDIVTENPT